MKRSAYILALVLLACGEPPKDEPQGPNVPEHVDPELQPYVDEFMADCETYGADCDFRGLYVYLAPPPDAFLAGRCIRSDSRIVYINPVMYEWTYRETTFHELGHCVLNRPHAPEGSGAIMESGNEYERHSPAEWDSRVAELFSE